jgi:hypothetical protein
VEATEPGGLTEVRALSEVNLIPYYQRIWKTYLTRDLEVHPLIGLVVLLRAVREMDFVFFVVAVNEVFDDRVRFPEGKVIVIVIDDGGDAWVRRGEKGLRRRVNNTHGHWGCAWCARELYVHPTGSRDT